ncbi:MAG: PAS domain S-box protein [Desulfomonile tiedjei]|nr:PAS domain S-box protein [Desulfomonile tiedjei]
MDMVLRVLIVEDSESDAGLIVRHLERAGYSPIHERVETAEEMGAALDQGDWDIVVADYSMPRFDALAALRLLQARGRDIPFIVVSGSIGEDTAVAMMKAGAHDYVMKENLPRLIPAVQRELGDAQVRRERRRAEEALRQSEEKYRNILETIEDSYVETDLAGNVTFFNPSTCRMAGYPADELKGMNYRQLADEPTRERIKEVFQKIYATGKAVKIFAHDLIRKDGTRAHVETSVSLIRDGHGNPMGFRGIGRDVTERRLAEEERARLATAIEQAAEGFIVNDTNWIIQYVNPALERISGYEKNEIIGQHLRVFKSGKHGKEFYRQIRETLTRGDVWSGRAISKKKDGTLYEVEITASPVRDKSGTIINYVSMHRDITREVKLERELRQAQKMEALGTLAGGIAHDFNNILAAIVGYTEMASLRVPQGSPVHRYLTQVLDSSSRATDLVNHILAFSRQSEQERKPVPIGAIVREALQLLRSSLPSTIEILPEIAVQPGGSIVLADPTQIHQVVMNLCTNAAHAMRVKGGRLGVRLEDTVVDASLASRYSGLKPGAHVCLTVSDTGHGMDSATVERIFDPYFTTKGPGEGTGLGLAVVRGIVKNHGGAIVVYSEPDQGTTFHVFLPRIDEEIALETTVIESLPRGNERVLFVDDEHVLVDLGTEMLQSLGYRTVGTTSSVEALETFRCQPDAFDLVITDMTMPGLRGTELARELIAARPDIPIILCTGFSDLIDRERAKETGIRELVMKPYVIGNLASTIREVLEEQKA